MLGSYEVPMNVNFRRQSFQTGGIATDRAGAVTTARLDVRGVHPGGLLPTRRLGHARTRAPRDDSPVARQATAPRRPTIGSRRRIVEILPGFAGSLSRRSL